MEAKEQALELVNKFKLEPIKPFSIMHPEHTKQCALIAVDEIIKALNDDIYIQGETDIDSHRDYWSLVKQEIQNL